MSKGLICDRCGAVNTTFKDMNNITITPYNGNMLKADGKSKRYDLCKDCTETVMQYINNEVQMVIFNDRKTPDETD